MEIRQRPACARKKTANHRAESEAHAEARSEQAHGLGALFRRRGIGEEALRDAERAAEKAVDDADRDRQP